ncbi:hypothetical protein [Streptomyces sp. NPDC001678]|uniref:hypothetical protein n=1 Tax=Streptomyces sp. NPDC001678 TaxID=3364599 RepID=UPI0036CDF6F2
MPLPGGDEQGQWLLSPLDRQVQVGRQPAARASEPVITTALIHFRNGPEAGGRRTNASPRDARAGDDAVGDVTNG